MKELCKWFLAICCAVVMIITGPSTNTSATDINIEDIAVDPESEEILEESLAEQIDEEETIITIPDEGDIEQEKNDLIAENMRLKQELRNARMNVEIVKKSDSPEVTNVDIIRRLSRLEKMVYGAPKTERSSLNSGNYTEDVYEEE